MTHLGWAEMVTQQGRSRAHSRAVTTGKKSGEDILDCSGGTQCRAVKQGIFLFILSQLCCLSDDHFMKLENSLLFYGFVSLSCIFCKLIQQCVTQPNPPFNKLSVNKIALILLESL